MQALQSSPTLKPLTNIVDDPKEPTNQIEEFYVKCRGAATIAKLKVANTALTHFSITLVKNGHCRAEYNSPLEFSQAQYQPNIVPRMLRPYFPTFEKRDSLFHQVQISMAKVC